MICQDTQIAPFEARGEQGGPKWEERVHPNAFFGSKARLPAETMKTQITFAKVIFLPR